MPYMTTPWVHSPEDAIADCLDRRDSTRTVIVLCRFVGPWHDLSEVPLPPNRDEARDELYVLGPRAVELVKPCSTWPFNDKSKDGLTKVIKPGVYKGMWVRGMHGGEHGRREALCGFGYDKPEAWVYGLDGTPKNTTDPWVRGWNMHSNRGTSEACVTLPEHDDVEDVLHVLEGRPGRAELDGEQCYDVWLYHVRGE